VLFRSNSDNISWNGPNKSVIHENSLININPEFTSFVDEYYTLNENSPAIGAGVHFTFADVDFLGNKFNQSRSIGAFEFIESATHIKTQSESEQMILYPNPTNNCFSINLDNIDYVEIYDFKGQLSKRMMQRTEYNINELSNGLYLVKIVHNNTIYKTILLKN